MPPNASHGQMSFSLPPDLVAYIGEIDNFIATKIAPLQASNDNDRFFDHRREHARTDWDNKGLPREDWEQLLAQSRKLADEAGFYRFCLPEEYGGKNGGNLWMAAIRMHLAKKGLGLFNDLQNEHSVVGNFPDVLMVREFGTPEQKKEFIAGRLEGRRSFGFGLTEPNHGSDATHMFTHAVKTRRVVLTGGSLLGRRCGSRVRIKLRI
jgi:acyl-CoA dehydrogenase